MASPAFLFPHVLYSNSVPLPDVVPVKFRGFSCDLKANNVPVSEYYQQNLMVRDPEVRSRRFMDEVVAYDADMKVERWLDDLKAYGMVPDLESCLIEQENQKAFDELRAFDAFMSNGLKNIVTKPDEVKKIAIWQVFKEEKEDFKLKTIDKEKKQEEEDGSEEFEAYDDYCAMKHMRRQGAKRHRRLLSRKHKYRRI